MTFRSALLLLPLILMLIVGGLIGVWMANPTPASAQLGVPFGGPITFTWWCTCSFGIALTIGPPVPANVVFQLGRSIPYAFGQVFRPGPWTLGTWTPGGTCTYYVGVGCSAYPVAGTIGMIGTSL